MQSPKVIAFMSQYISCMIECTENRAEPMQKKMEPGAGEIEGDPWAYSEVILISQPAHITMRKSTHLNNLGGKCELWDCSWMQVR